MTSSAEEVDAEDVKLITLARGARERAGARTGVAVRDETGRTYAGADADFPSGSVGAATIVLGQAWISGARALEAMVIVNADDTSHEFGLVADIANAHTYVLFCALDGTVLQRLSAQALPGLNGHR